MPLICSTLFNWGNVVASAVYYTLRDDQLVFYQQVHATAAVQAHTFVLHRLQMLQLETNAILRVLRGEFFLTSGLASQPASVSYEPKLEVTTHSKRQGTYF